MKTGKLVVIIVLQLVFIFGIAAVFAYYLLESIDNEGKDYQCYVAVNVTADGDELTDEGVKQVYGLNSLSDVMTVYLKNSGDCSIVLMGEGDMGTWSKKNDIITIDAVKKKLRMKKNFNRLIYKTEDEGQELRFVLKKTKKLPASLRKNPEFTYGLKYTKKDTRDLSNFMLGGQYAIAKDTIYGKFFDLRRGGENTVFASSGTDGNKYQVLAKGGQAKYLTVHKGYLYYKWVPSNGDVENVGRLSLEEGSQEVLRKGDCDYVQVRFGII